MTTESLSVTIEGELLTVEIGTVAAPAGGGGGSAAWGDITGTLSAQTDLNSALGLKAPLASPTFTGVPAAPTAAGATSTTQVATTAFVAGEVTTHTGATDPHGDRSFATSAVSTHAGAVDPHGDRAYADGLAGNYATAAQGAAADSAVQDVGAEINAATAATLDDADAVGFFDSVASALRKITWANVKATIKTYTDTLYSALGHGHANTDITGLGGAAVLAVGTTAGTVAAGDDSRLTDDRTASGLRSATTVVSVSAATAPSSGQVLTATAGTTATWQTPSGGSSNTKWIGAGELIPRVTNGAGIDGEELATNDINLDYLAFDSATSEGAQVSFAWPGAYTTFTAQFHWTAASGSGTVTWTAAARCYADDDALDQAQGTAQSVTDTLLAANDAHKSSATSAVTPGGTVASGNLCVAQFTRDIADTLAVDARLIGVMLSFA